jgi:hypothetical protein
VAVIGRALAVLIFFVGLAFWAIGGWQVYESNTVFGAVLVLAGGVLVVGVVSWWRRDPDAGFEAVWHGVIDFFSRA